MSRTGFKPVRTGGWYGVDCMYAMVGKLMAQPGQREALAQILQQAAQVVGTMAGCHLYLVHADAGDEVTLWIYEAWDDKAAHDASLQDGRVRALIGQAMPILGGAPDGHALRLLGGHGGPMAAGASG